VRVAVVGSRDYPDLAQVGRYIRALPRGTVVVSGGARGVDSRAESAARNAGLVTDIYLADWDLHGKKAGYVRNMLLVDACDKLVAFWDGTSRGTKHAIELARSAGKRVVVFEPSTRGGGGEKH